MERWKGHYLALLVITVAGCSKAPQVVFSEDGKKLAYESNPSRLSVVDTSNPATKQSFVVGNVADMSWSPSGRFLILADSAVLADSPPTKTVVIDTLTGNRKRLPVHMGGPFLWPKGESLVVGFTLTDPAVKVEPKHLPDLTLTTFDVAKNRATASFRVGPYTPWTILPDKKTYLLSDGRNDAYEWSAGKLAKFPDLSHGFTGQPASVSQGGRILFVDSAADGSWNKAFSLDWRGRREDIQLPPDLVSSSPKPRLIRSIVGISPDAKWIVVLRREDLSPEPALNDMEHYVTGRWMNSKLSGLRLQQMQDRVQIRDTYELVERVGGRTLTIAETTPEDGSLGTGSLNWSANGRYLAFSTWGSTRTPVWLVDLDTLNRTKL